MRSIYRLEPAVKTLHEAYDRDHVPMEEFAGVTLDDLYRTETTFQTNLCVYKLVKPDAEDGKWTAELVRRSLCNYPETMYLNLLETHFAFIQDVRMYCNSEVRCLVMERHTGAMSTRAYVYGGCASSLSWWRVPFYSICARKSGRREHSSG